MEKRSFRTLEGMRGLAAICVFAYHAGEFVEPFENPLSYLAVDLFFVLSGFVLEHAYGPRLAAGFSSVTFFVQRFFRFYPLYILGTAIGIFGAVVSFVLGQGTFDLKSLSLSIGSSLVMLPSMTWRQHPALFPLNGPAWSLFLELVVNGLFAVVWLRLTRPVLLALIALSGIALAAFILHYQTADFGYAWVTVPASIPRVLFSFFLGVMLYRLHRLEHRGSMLSLAVLGAGILALVLPAASVEAPYALACIFLVFPALVFAGAAWEPPALLAPVVVWLGRISFPLYAVHLPALEIIRRAYTVLGIPLDRYAPFSGLLILAVFLFGSTLLATFYDEALRRRIRRPGGLALKAGE